MEDKKINELESIELISEMIRKTKSEAPMKQDYNSFLLYGYAVVLISVAVWGLIRYTGDLRCMFGWLAMLLLYLWSAFTGRHTEQDTITYLQGMINTVWKIIGSMFGLTIIAITGIGLLTERMDFSLMMPLSIIYAGIGTSMTGLVIKEKWLVWPPLAGLFSAIYMLLSGSCNNEWNLLIGLSFLVFMVVPAHIVRNKIGQP